MATPKTAIPVPIPTAALVLRDDDLAAGTALPLFVGLLVVLEVIMGEVAVGIAVSPCILCPRSASGGGAKNVSLVGSREPFLEQDHKPVVLSNITCLVLTPAVE